MNILEVRDSFIKFENDERYEVSSFIKIFDLENCYIAQIVQVKDAGSKFILLAKLLFVYNEGFYSYNGNIPSNDSLIEKFEFEEINKIFRTKNSLLIGKFVDSEQKIFVDKEFFNKQSLLVFDNVDNNKLIVSNLVKQFKSSIIIDTVGVYSNPDFVAGVDFKLPLNLDALDFIYQDCLNDATVESKALIKEIFMDLVEYSKSVSFLLFKTLKDTIDDMVNKSHVFKLIVLKNKLDKFDKLGYFANKIEEIDNLKNILLKDRVVIDLSKLDPVLMNRYLMTIYSTLESLNLDAQVFIETSNMITKASFKKILLSEIKSTLIINSKFRYINEFKSMFNNFIIEPNVSNNEIFKANSILLKHAPKNTFLAVGELTNYISLFVNNVQIEDSDIVDENKFVENDELDSNVDCADGIEENDLADNAFDNLENDLEDDLNESVSSDMPERKFTVEEIEQKSSEIINNVAKNIDNDSNLTDVSIFDEVEESNADVIVENSLLELENNTDKTSEDFVDVEINENTKVETNIDSENGENSFSVNVENVLLEDSNVLLDEEIASVVDDAQVSTLDNINADNDDLATVSEEVAELDMIKDEQVSNNQDAVVSDCENSFIVENSFDEDISAIKDSEVESSLSEFNDDSQIVEISEDYDILSDYDDELLESNNDNVMVDFEAAQAEEEIKTLDDYGNFGVLSLTDENENNEIDSIVEVSDDSNFEPDVIVEIDDYDNSSEVEDLDKAIKEDVDRVFTTIKDDSLSDSDLDFIDELNNNTYEDLITEGSYEELPELVEQEEESLEISPVVEVNEGLDDDEQILETKTSTTPIIPVYDADIPNEDLVVSDVIEQGDSVLHAKYGNGIVEKMIKYGTKTLYSINFDNVGRRLLDPNLTEIKKCK